MRAVGEWRRWLWTIDPCCGKPSADLECVWDLSKKSKLGILETTSRYTVAGEQAKATSAAFEVVFAPTATASLQSFTATKSVLVLSVLDNVKSRLTFLRRCDLAWLDVGSEEVGQIRGCSVSPVMQREYRVGARCETRVER